MLETLRRIEKDPSLLGASAHLIAIGRKWNERESAAQTRDRTGAHARAHADTNTDTNPAASAGGTGTSQRAEAADPGKSDGSTAIAMKKILLVLGLAACSGNSDADIMLIRFDTGTVAIHTPTDTVQLQVEIAEDENQRTYGLMDRDSLARQWGMLFVYNTVQDSATGFWMFRTRIPLDIAYIDSTGTIGAITAMDPCSSPEPRWCNPYPAGVRYQSALEVNRGFFRDHGIAVGAKVVRGR
jgi:uncharacterized protein